METIKISTDLCNYLLEIEALINFRLPYFMAAKEMIDNIVKSENSSEHKLKRIQSILRGENRHV